jgi:3-oxoacyl-[acyl-carrier-protein] synthase II
MVPTMPAARREPRRLPERAVDGARRPVEVVVTGVGAVTGLGPDAETFWRRALAGETRVVPIPEAWASYSPLRSSAWAPLGDDWRRDTPLLTRVERRQMDPSAELALQAAEEALTVAGLVPRPREGRRGSFEVAADPARSAVFLGTGVGGLTSALDSARRIALDRPKQRLAAVAEALRSTAADLPGLTEAAAEIEAVLAALPVPRAFHPYSVAMAMPNAAASHLSIKLGFTGPCRTYAAACASGTVALGRALTALRRGECDLALAGGTEYLADPYGSVFRGFDAVGALCQATADTEAGPETVNRPFDAGRSGFLFAEGGAGVLVLETAEGAARRGATPMARVLGYGETGDAHNVMVMDPAGTEIRRAVTACLEDAGLGAADVDHVNAHGTGTEANDLLEARVLEEVLGERAGEVSVSATKSLLGHTLGASGAIEAVAAVLTLSRGVAHPCRNLEDPVSERLGFVRQALEHHPRIALSQSFAFGGHNAVVALGCP